MNTEITGVKNSGNFFVSEIYCSQECKLIHESAKIRIEQLEKKIIDFEQRFDTLQTPFWKRVIFWIDGWPWHDLNGAQKWRPWRKWWSS